MSCLGLVFVQGYYSELKQTNKKSYEMYVNWNKIKYYNNFFQLVAQTTILIFI